MKIQNYTKKSIKIKSQQLSWRRKKNAEVLGRFSRTYHMSTSVAQWWKHCCIWGRLPFHETSCSLFWLTLHVGSVHCSISFIRFPKADKPRWILSNSHRHHLLDQINRPTNPESVALLLCPTDVIFCLKKCKEKKMWGIHNHFFLNVSF